MTTSEKYHSIVTYSHKEHTIYAPRAGGQVIIIMIDGLYE